MEEFEEKSSELQISMSKKLLANINISRIKTEM